MRNNLNSISSAWQPDAFYLHRYSVSLQFNIILDILVYTKVEGNKFLLLVAEDLRSLIDEVFISIFGMLHRYHRVELGRASARCH